MINKASRSPHETSNPDVGCVRYAHGFCSNNPSPNAGWVCAAHALPSGCLKKCRLLFHELVEQREFGDDASLAAKLMAQLSGQPVPKKDAAPLSDDLDSQTPLRMTEFKRDILGRLIHTLARDNDKVQETVYGYDRTGNLTHSTDQRTGTTRFEYDKLGRITK